VGHRADGLWCVNNLPKVVSFLLPENAVVRYRTSDLAVTGSDTPLDYQAT